MVRIAVVKRVILGAIFFSLFFVNAYPQSDTIFKAIDLTYVTVPLSSRSSETDMAISTAPLGIEPSPFIIWHSPSLGEYGAMMMTINPATGSQGGDRMKLRMPADHIPVDAIWARQFTSTAKSLGVEPTPWIVFRDFMLYTFPVAFEASGTPVAGTPISIFPGGNPGAYGNATCMTELPGSEFSDGLPRLFVGTDNASVVVLVKPVGAGITVEGVISGIGAGTIIDVEPIPQYGYIALGILKANKIYGIRYVPGHIVNQFSLVDTRTEATTHFDTFGDDGMPLSDPAGSVKMVLANGSLQLGLATVGAFLAGQQTLTLTLSNIRYSVKSIVTGSLLMLRTDEAAVDIDLAFGETGGFSGCEVTLTDSTQDICGYKCGDANGDNSINIGDAVYVINYIFKSGPAPVPLEAADANCDHAVNVGDAVYVVNFIFKGGAAPCCP